jgi:hypothetical protein
MGCETLWLESDDSRRDLNSACRFRIRAVEIMFGQTSEVVPLSETAG